MIFIRIGKDFVVAAEFVRTFEWANGELGITLGDGTYKLFNDPDRAIFNEIKAGFFEDFDPGEE